MLSLSHCWQTGSSPWQLAFDQTILISVSLPMFVNLEFPQGPSLLSKPWLKVFPIMVSFGRQVTQEDGRHRDRRRNSIWRCEKTIITTLLSAVQRMKSSFHSCLGGASSHYSKIFCCCIDLSKDLNQMCLLFFIKGNKNLQSSRKHAEF